MPHFRAPEGKIIGIQNLIWESKRSHQVVVGRLISARTNRTGGRRDIYLAASRELPSLIVMSKTESSAVSQNVDAFASEIFTDADETRKVSEARFQKFTLMSYFLYGFGWIFSVIGIFVRGYSQTEETW